jgi:hypothetical protein
MKLAAGRDAHRVTRHVGRWASSLVAALALAACCGCQVLIPDGLPGGFGLSEDARIAKQAKADSFPSPADVGLTPENMAR